MNDFIYVTVPRPDWNEIELILWYLMEAASIGIVQVRSLPFMPPPSRPYL